MTMASTDPSTLAAAFIAQAHSTGIIGGALTGGKFRRGQRSERAQARGKRHAHDESQRDEEHAAHQQAVAEVQTDQRGQTARQEEYVGEKRHDDEHKRHPAQICARQPDDAKTGCLRRWRA